LKNKQEATEFYLRSSLKFLECANILESENLKDALKMYNDTCHFLQRIKNICKDAGETSRIKLCNDCMDVARQRMAKLTHQTRHESTSGIDSVPQLLQYVRQNLEKQ